jgi:recombination protein RecT
MQSQKQQLVKIQHHELEITLKKMQNKFIEALPSHINVNKFLRVVINAAVKNPKLLECDKYSFFLAVMQAAQLGLEPDGLLGQAYLIPYNTNVQLQIGYRGYITLAMQSGYISFISAEKVHENDDYDFDYFGTPRFKPLLLSLIHI